MAPAGISVLIAGHGQRPGKISICDKSTWPPVFANRYLHSLDIANSLPKLKITPDGWFGRV
jgi:hypothetical protein